MLTESIRVEKTAYEAGYKSPTQFNREYKRQFGEPPYRDIRRLITAQSTLKNDDAIQTQIS